MTADGDPWLSDDERQFFNKELDDQHRLMMRQLIESLCIPYGTQPEPTKEKTDEHNVRDDDREERRA